MTVRTSWLIGSSTISTNTTLVVNGSNHVVALGTRYLYDPTASLSWIKQVENAIAAEVAGSTVTILQNRKVHIDFDGVSTSLTIPSALASILGFTGSPYGAATSRTAEQVSPLLWSPGWPENPSNSPVGAPGRKEWDRVMTSSPTGLTYDVTLHHSVTKVEWSWQAVRQDRAWTASEADGEYVVFFENTIVPGNRFKLYSSMYEDDSSSTAVSWVSPLGPYIVPEPKYDWFQRFVANSDSLGANITIGALKTSEIS